MAQQVTYRVMIGGQTASSRLQESTCQLLALQVELTMDGVGGRCLLELSGATTTLHADDAVSVELSAGENPQRVFTGKVETVRIGAASQQVVASDGLVVLARLELEAAYESVQVGFIVRDILQQAGLTPGKVETGPQLTAYALHRGPRALRHLQELTALAGAELYTDDQGMVHFAAPQPGPAEHTFQYAQDVRSLELQAAPPLYDSIEVWGEGAASTQGADKYYWLVTDLTGVNGKAAVNASGQVTPGSTGQRPRYVSRGAIRSGEAARDMAAAQMKRVVARWLRGHLEVGETPGVEPGKLVRIEGLPADHSAATLLQGGRLPRVRRVRHTLDRQRGFITRLDFCNGDTDRQGQVVGRAELAHRGIAYPGGTAGAAAAGQRLSGSGAGAAHLGVGRTIVR